MKFLHTFTREGRADGKSFIEVNDITCYKVEIKKSDARRDIPVECICYTHDGSKYVLTPTRPINTKEDIALLQNFIVELVKTIAKTPDGCVIRGYTPNEMEWGIVVDGVTA